MVRNGVCRKECGTEWASVAQLAGHVVRKRLVAGSTPQGATGSDSGCPCCGWPHKNPHALPVAWHGTALEKGDVGDGMGAFCQQQRPRATASGAVPEPVTCPGVSATKSTSPSAGCVSFHLAATACNRPGLHATLPGRTHQLRAITYCRDIHSERLLSSAGRACAS